MNISKEAREAATHINNLYATMYMDVHATAGPWGTLHDKDVAEVIQDAIDRALSSVKEELPNETLDEYNMRVMMNNQSSANATAPTTQEQSPNETGDTFTAFYNAIHNAEYPSYVRKGQFAFNQLNAIRPDLADDVRGTALDPFHLNSRLPEFWAFLKKNWNQRVPQIPDANHEAVGSSVSLPKSARLRQRLTLEPRNLKLSVLPLPRCLSLMSETLTPQANESSTQTGHTPGPWTLTHDPDGRAAEGATQGLEIIIEREDYEREDGSECGRHIAFCFGAGTTNDTQALADARLIAAAPDLLEALQWYASAQYPDDGSGRPPEAFQRRAKEAIAKACDLSNA